MKMAVLLPGMTRRHRKCLPNFNDVFGAYRPDVFSSMWDVDGCLLSKDYRAAADSPSVSVELISPQAVDEEFGFKRMRVESWSQWLGNHLDMIADYCELHPSAGEQMMANGVFGQYHQVSQTFNLIDNPESYDLIVRWRFDIKARPIEFTDTGGICFCASCHASETAPADLYFYGPPELMRRACNLYDFALATDPFDPRDYSEIHKTYTPEVLMHKMLIENNIQFQTGKPAEIVR